MKLIIDSDLGVDDAAALILALTYQKIDMQILGLTTVVGNISSMDQIVANASRILRLVERTEIPIYVGSTGPLIKNLSQMDFSLTKPISFYHGMDGLGDCPDVDPPLVQSDFEAAEKEISAVNFILKSANQYPGDITLVCLGPLTNIALALKMDESLPWKIKDIIVMGGNVYGTGNLPFYSTAEHNFYKDPEAAYIVLREMSMTKIIPWEMYQKQTASKAFITSYYSDKTKRTSFIKSISCKGFEDLKNSSLEVSFCDELAMAVCLEPAIVLKADRCVATVELYGHVTRGQLAIDWKNWNKAKPNVEIVTDYDVKAVESMLLKSVGL